MNVYITSKAHVKLWAYIRSVNTEIGGWGYAKLIDSGDLVWEDTFLVPQIASASEVDFESAGGDAVAVEKAVTDGVLDKEGFVWVSWHSHHTMNAFWSSTDDKRIAELHRSGIEHLLSFVGCHDHKRKLRYDAFNVNHAGIVIPQITMDDLTMLLDPQDEMFSNILADVEQNVKKREFGKQAPKQASKQAPPSPAKTDNFDGLSIRDALEIKEYMDDFGLSYADAREIVLDTTPVGADAFDQQAWGGND